MTTTEEEVLARRLLPTWPRRSAGYKISLGDSNCDGVIEADADGDGLPDPFDRFNGPDFADYDRDGISNWADADPASRNAGVAGGYYYSSADAAVEAQERALLEEARRLANQNAGIRVALDYLDRHQRNWEQQDSDSDGMYDVSDPQPSLRALDDDDGDGERNWHDTLPLNNGYQ
jgi:hypothetical protein